MIVTRQKPPDEIIKILKGYNRIFLIGCGECATICKTGGEAELKAVQALLIASGKIVTGISMPSAPCLASKVKAELARNTPVLKNSDAVLVLACGLGVQSVKENARLKRDIFPACDTLFGAVMDARGDFYEKCFACGECILDTTAGICPVTLCPKGMLNGPCGGMNKGKCEVDTERDCAWVLIYQRLKDKGRVDQLKKRLPPRDYRKSNKPGRVVLA